MSVLYCTTWGAAQLWLADSEWINDNWRGETWKREKFAEGRRPLEGKKNGVEERIGMFGRRHRRHAEAMGEDWSGVSGRGGTLILTTQAARHRQENKVRVPRNKAVFTSLR